MAKNKNQKRKAKLKARGKQRAINHNAINSCYVDERKIVLAFPDVNDRLHYIRSLIKELDNAYE